MAVLSARLDSTRAGLHLIHIELGIDSIDPRHQCGKDFHPPGAKFAEILQPAPHNRDGRAGPGGYRLERSNSANFRSLTRYDPISQRGGSWPAGNYTIFYCPNSEARLELSERGERFHPLRTSPRNRGRKPAVTCHRAAGRLTNNALAKQWRS